MAGLRVLILASSAILVAAQIKFPDSKDTTASSSSAFTASPPAPPSASPPARSPASVSASASAKPASSAAADSPSPVGQTRFAGSPLGILDPLGIFSSPCDRCSSFDQHCCRTQGVCCGFQPVRPVGPPIQPFPGQFPGQHGGSFPGQHGGNFPGQTGGHFPGQTGGHFPGQSGGHFPGQSGGHFPGQPGGHFPGQPGGHFPGHVGGVKGGVCPLPRGIQHGVHRFSSASAPCVTECQIDFECPNIQKCCPVGCSNVCRTPEAAPPIVEPAIKPGFCPRPHGGFHGLRSGAATPQADPGVDPSALTRKEQRQQDRKELRQQERREQRQQERGVAGGRSRRSPHHQEDPNDRREIRLNRRNRVSGRVIRSSEDSPRRVARQSPAGAAASHGGAQANQRFLFGNPFCHSSCVRDYDCPDIQKCCGRCCVRPF